MAHRSVNMDVRLSLMGFILIYKSTIRAPRTSLLYGCGFPVRSSNSCKSSSRGPTTRAYKSMSPIARPALTVRMQVVIFEIQRMLLPHFSPVSVGIALPVRKMSRTYLLPAAQTIERLTNSYLSPYFALLWDISQLANRHQHPFMISNFILELHVLITFHKGQQPIRNDKPQSPRRLRSREKPQSY